MSAAESQHLALPSVAVAAPETGIVDWYEDQRHYRVRTLDWSEWERHAAFQRLRGDVFVKQLRWPIPLEADGREADRYDIGGGKAISIHCVYGVDDQGGEHLLGGLRIFKLRSWDDAMLAHEFASSGMIPPHVLSQLEERFAADQLTEITRFCMIRPTKGSVRTRHETREEVPFRSLVPLNFDMAVARDLCYGVMVREAVEFERDYTLALMDSRIVRVMNAMHFVFDEVYAVNLHRRDGYALILGDLGACLRNVYQTDGLIRARRIASVSRRETFPWLYR